MLTFCTHLPRFLQKEMVSWYDSWILTFCTHFLPAVCFLQKEMVSWYQSWILTFCAHLQCALYLLQKENGQLVSIMDFDILHPLSSVALSTAKRNGLIGIKHAFCHSALTILFYRLEKIYLVGIKQKLFQSALT